MSTAAHHDPRLAQLHAEVLAIEAAMHEAAHEALLVHKRAGQPLVTWHDGRVVLIPADQIPVDESGPKH
jgi:hypothetical protein